MSREILDCLKRERNIYNIILSQITALKCTPALSALLYYTSRSKNRRKLRRNRLLDAGWLTNLQQLQSARPDHVRDESSSCCFPRELASFVRPREIAAFNPRHVTRSPPIGKKVF